MVTVELTQLLDLITKKSKNLQNGKEFWDKENRHEIQNWAEQSYLAEVESRTQGSRSMQST